MKHYTDPTGNRYEEHEVSVAKQFLSDPTAIRLAIAFADGWDSEKIRAIGAEYESIRAARQVAGIDPGRPLPLVRDGETYRMLPLTTHSVSSRCANLQAAARQAKWPAAGETSSMVGAHEAIRLGRHGDKYTVTREWYTPESYADDDLSVTGFALPPVAGQTRRHATVYGASPEEAIAQMDRLGI